MARDCHGNRIRHAGALHIPYCRTAQIMKSENGKTGALACLFSVRFGTDAASRTTSSWMAVSANLGAGALGTLNHEIEMESFSEEAFPVIN